MIADCRLQIDDCGLRNDELGSPPIGGLQSSFINDSVSIPDCESLMFGGLNPFLPAKSATGVR